MLTPKHPAYHVPLPSEQYCYAEGNLTFSDVSSAEWVRRTGAAYIDADGERDLGNIDRMMYESDLFVAEGDWGKVRIRTKSFPRFEL